VKKIDKKEILKEISNSNVLSVTDIQSLADIVSIGKTIKTVTAKDYYHTSRFSKVADVLVNSYSEVFLNFMVNVFITVIEMQRQCYLNNLVGYILAKVKFYLHAQSN
jgi:hypothetical protein